MNFRSFWSDDNLLWETLLLSLGMHFLLFHIGNLSFRLHEKHVVEIDITNMGHLGMPGGGRRTAAPAPPKPVARPKEWVKPAPNQKVIPAPIPTQPVAAPALEEETPAPAGPVGTGTGEYGIGTGDGSPNALSRLPQLKNLSDLGAILRRYYPEEARRERKEGAVTLDLHIDTDGRVQSADVVNSGGSAFDVAAQQIAKLLRFTPAFVGSQRVAVKMRQTIQFKLED